MYTASLAVYASCVAYQHFFACTATVWAWPEDEWSPTLAVKENPASQLPSRRSTKHQISTANTSNHYSSSKVSHLFAYSQQVKDSCQLVTAGRGAGS